MKLDIHHKHIMKVIDRDKKEDGWTLVGDALYPYFRENMPGELVEFCCEKGCFKAKLTQKGNNILEAMAWL